MEEKVWHPRPDALSWPLVRWRGWISAGPRKAQALHCNADVYTTAFCDGSNANRRHRDHEEWTKSPSPVYAIAYPDASLAGSAHGRHPHCSSSSLSVASTVHSLLALSGRQLLVRAAPLVLPPSNATFCKRSRSLHRDDDDNAAHHHVMPLY